MKVLICNAGSTSLKFKVYDMPAEKVLAQGKVERVGSTCDAIFQYKNCITNRAIDRSKQSIPDYKTGINAFLDCLLSEADGVLGSINEIDRVGFKTVVSKGYYGVHELTEPVLKGMKEWIVIAQTHSGAYLEAIQTMREFLPATMFIGVFETAYHRTIPLERRIYGVPYEWYTDYGVQRMGYHGASHGYIADVLSRESKRYKAISCHLGGSCSLCAIEDGKSVNTSFGMSLQSGIIHSNRVGDMDCDITVFLESQGLAPEDIREGLQKRGGLLGLSGVSGDIRYVQEAAEQGNERAKLAIDVFVNGIVHYIGAFYANLGGLDYLAFTGGIGENSTYIRSRVCTKLVHTGISLSEEKNVACHGAGVISQDDSKVKIHVIPANEELGVARRTYAY